MLLNKEIDKIKLLETGNKKFKQSVECILVLNMGIKVKSLNIQYPKLAKPKKYFVLGHADVEKDRVLQVTANTLLKNPHKYEKQIKKRVCVISALSEYTSIVRNKNKHPLVKSGPTVLKQNMKLEQVMAEKDSKIELKIATKKSICLKVANEISELDPRDIDLVVHLVQTSLNELKQEKRKIKIEKIYLKTTMGKVLQIR